jgi:hypothetical protein
MFKRIKTINTYQFFIQSTLRSKSNSGHLQMLISMVLLFNGHNSYTYVAIQAQPASPDAYLAGLSPFLGACSFCQGVYLQTKTQSIQ